ncbi:MAG: hypothetical protein WC516_04940 [Patescibacteria group bacterium]|jgi:hypothetical protein
MINHINVEKLAEIFISFFVDLNFNEKLEKVTFLEILLGFMYSYRKVLKSIELINVITPEKLIQIGEILNKSVEENIKLECESELYKLLEQIKNQPKEEERDGKKD